MLLNCCGGCVDAGVGGGEDGRGGGCSGTGGGGGCLGDCDGECGEGWRDDREAIGGEAEGKC